MIKAIILVVIAAITPPITAQREARRMADTVIANSHSVADGRVELYGVSGWKYEAGSLLDGMTAMYRATGNRRYLDYIISVVDPLIDAQGHVKEFNPEAHSLDNIEMGRVAVFLFRETKNPKYAAAAKQMREALADQPRTQSGGFWHKQIYPNQMWLDGAYMAEPFYASYANAFHEASDFDDIAKQFILMNANMRDAHTGLLRHGWDESRQMPWADKQTGMSPEVWARAMGWYMVALVDTIELFPANHPKRAALIGILREQTKAVMAQQNPHTKLWRDVLSRPAAPENFEEASASCMFIYALTKAAQMGLVSKDAAVAAHEAWLALNCTFVTQGNSGPVLNGIVAVSGLGGKPYRSGDYDYYIHEKRVSNDLKGIGAYLMAGSRFERSSRSKVR